MNDLEIKYSYAAGIIDGEGSIDVSVAKAGQNKWTTRRTDSYRSRVKVSMCDKEVPEFMQALFGGKIYTMIPRNNNHRVQYSWEIHGLVVKDCLIKLLPYLIIKKRRAELAIELVNRQSYRRLTNKGRSGIIRITPEEFALRKKIIDELSILNKRGTNINNIIVTNR